MSVFRLKANREGFKVLACAIALQSVFGFVLGWGFAAFVVMAGYVGYSIGSTRGFTQGLDHSLAEQLRAILKAMTEIEDEMAGELAPDHPMRVGLARERAIVLEELRRVA